MLSLSKTLGHKYIIKGMNIHTYAYNLSIYLPLFSALAAGWALQGFSSVFPKGLHIPEFFGGFGILTLRGKGFRIERSGFFGGWASNGIYQYIYAKECKRWGEKTFVREGENAYLIKAAFRERQGTTERGLTGAVDLVMSQMTGGHNKWFS